MVSILTAGVVLAGGMASFAAEGDVVESGSTGDCSYSVIEDGSDASSPYTIYISGTGKTGDYTLDSTSQESTTAPWKEYLKKTYRVEAGDGVTEIGTYTFKAPNLDTPKIGEVSLADSVKHVDRGAFKDQSRLRKISFGNGLETIGTEAFYRTIPDKLVFPETLRVIYERAFAGGINFPQVDLPDSVKTVREGAFQNCTGIRVVNLSGGMGLVYEDTFANCSNLTGVVIPKNILSIQKNAFNKTPKLTDVYYGGTKDEWDSIEILDGNDSLKSATVHYGLTDAIKLTPAYPVVGSTLRVMFGGALDFHRDMNGFQVQWQRSANGTSGWTDISNPTEEEQGPERYKVTESDLGYYFRVRIRKTGFENDAYSEAVKVLDGISIDDSFSDTVLRQYMKDTFDPDGNGVLSEDDIADIYELHIGKMGIQSLVGVEKLDQLRKLYAYHNEIKNANLKGARNLVVLDLSENEDLSTVYVAKNPYLTELYLADTAVKSLNVSDNPELSKLELYRSRIDQVDIRRNPRLVDAALYGTVYETGYSTIRKSSKGSLALSGQVPLVVSLDAAAFPSEGLRTTLLNKSIDWNSDKVLSMQEALDVKNLALDDWEEKLTTLEGIQYFPNLKYLSASNCRVQTVDLSRNKSLESLYLGGNGLKGLDVTMLPGLLTLDVAYNPELKTLNTKSNPKLDDLWCEGCGLTVLDLSANPMLEGLQCGENQLKTLDLGKLTKLKRLYCGENPITTLDLSGNGALERLGVPYTGISRLDLSACPKLRDLSCSGCSLSELDLSLNPMLYSIGCYGNTIAKLDISRNSLLLEAYAGTKTEMTDPDTGTKYVIYRSKEDSLHSLYVDPNTKIVTTAEKKDPEGENGTWQSDSHGTWFRYTDGSYPKNAWVKIGGKWYHFDKKGYMQTGWLKDGKSWYYLGKNGVMVTGWKKIGKTWYFFKSGGSMASNEWCKGYWLNKNGSWTYQPKAKWKRNKTGWYYIDSKGWYPKNRWQRIDGKWYYFDSKGYCLTDTSKKIGKKTYKFNKSGACVNP